MKLLLRFSIALGISLLLIVPWGFTKEVTQPESELFNVDKKFAKMVMEEGTDAALPTFLSDSILTFAPSPTWISSIPKIKTIVDSNEQWQPYLAELSYSGDFGYTVGMYTSAAVGPAQTGQYLTIWEKQSANKWLATLRIKLPHEKVDTALEYLPVRRIDKQTKKNLAKRTSSECERSLRIADNVFATIAAKRGIVEAFHSTAATDVRLLRRNTIPVSGIDATKAWLALHPKKQNWTVLGCKVATSGELGYSYGEIHEVGNKNNGGPVAYYVRVWRLDSQDSWKLTVDLTCSVGKEQNR